VHGWATIFLYRTEQALRGKIDLDFLTRMFGKLTSNFGWWVNRKDRNGRNLFEGGFLGLDNIGVFDRSAPLPTGGYLEQADGTAWVALYAQNLLEIAIELVAHQPAYEHLAANFAVQFLLIGRAMNATSCISPRSTSSTFRLQLPTGSRRSSNGRPTCYARRPVPRCPGASWSISRLRLLSMAPA
jgi:hypothetical protein